MTKFYFKFVGYQGRRVVSLAFFVVAGFLFSLPSYSQITNDQIPRIAHAGGEIDNQSYTNSIEALDANYVIGFRFFEIDFSWTADGQLVCLHDWQDSFTRSYGFSIESALSLSQFEGLGKTEAGLQKCTLTSLAAWLEVHPEATLITDVKEENLRALRQIVENYPQLLSRIIPQLYQPDEYEAAKQLGFERVIWTLYQYAGGESDVLKQLDNMDVWAITMDTIRAENGLALSLGEIGIKSYVHTINEYADYLYFSSLGINEIYTDGLTLSKQAELAKSTDISIDESDFYKRLLEREAQLLSRRQDFLELPTLLYSYTTDQSNSLRNLNQIENVTISGNGFSFDAQGNDPYFSLPELEQNRNQIQTLLHITTEDASSVELFYVTLEDGSFSSDKKVSHVTKKGVNEIVLIVSADSPVVNIRLDPGSLAGRYTINAIEVRAD